MQHSVRSKCDLFVKQAKLKRDEKIEQLLLHLIWNLVKNVDCGMIFSKQPSMRNPVLLLFFRTFKVPCKFTLNAYEYQFIKNLHYCICKT